MPRKQVYGKRSTHVYSSFAGFTSPVKPRKQSEPIEVIEVAEELGRLAVHDAQSTEATDPVSRIRNPLSKRDSNVALVQPNSGKRAATKKRDSQDVKEDDTESKDVDSCISRSTTKNKRRQARKVEDAPKTVEKSLPLARTGAKDIVVSTLPQGDDPASATESATSRQEVPEISNMFTNHASSLLSLSSRPLAPFAAWSDQLSSHFSIAKIAEASFGEVYRLSLQRPHPMLSRTDESVLKIIALKPPKAARRKMTKAARKRIDMMSDPEDVGSEVRLMQRMTTIPGYTMFRECCVLQGRPGESFVSAWRDWNEAQKAKGKEASVFPDPGKKASYNDDQLWAVIEMQDAGTDLENVEVKDIWATWDVFWGVVLALGKGEDDVGFEHRDLHMGNICVSSRHRSLRDQRADDMTRIDPTMKYGFTGIETTLIDYTISRAEIAHETMGGDEDVAFLDLENDLSLFEGNAEEEYQYEIYRYMRAAMYLDDPLADLYERWTEVEDSGRTWRGYHPQTNLVWLHFILHKLLEQLDWPSKTTCVLSGDAGMKVTWNKALQLEQALARVQKLLDPQALPSSGLRSASDLVQLAVREEWLDEQDVKGSAPCTKKDTRRKARAVSQRNK